VPRQVAVIIGTSAVVIAVASRRQPLPGWLRLLVAFGLSGVVLASMSFSVGRDTGCALLAAMLAIKPAETFALRDARSLIGFALFAPFAAFLLDQGPLTLALGLVAGVLSLMALRQLADLESGDPRRASEWRSLGSVLRLLAIGLPLALAAFWLFPRMATPLWGVPERAQARPGLSDTMTPGQWGDLLNDDTPAARVRFNGPAPDTTQMYWRGPVLWHYDGRTWTQPAWLRNIPSAPMTSTGRAWDYELALEPTDRHQLIALDVPRAAPPGARLSHDFSLYVRKPLDALTTWRMRSSRPDAFEPTQRQMLRRMALALPDGFNPRTVSLARQWRAEAGDDDQAIVRRALAWIRSEFAYTLDVPLPGRHAVDEFLFGQKAGYCEQFSGSFVVLMRAAGIPARVVTGYAGGYHNPLGDYWLLRRSDAHAWAEVWLPDRGWTRVDPTAAVAPERVFDTLSTRATASGDVLGQLTPVLDVGDWLRRGWNDFVLGFDARRQRQMLRPLGLDDIAPRRLIVLFALVAGLALLVAAWLATRESGEPDPVLRAWHRVGARYAKLGLGREPFEPAGDWSARVLRARPQDTALQALSARFTEWRYAAVDTGGRAARDLVRALRAHRP
jgi:transglutaminase-like putative cysteine protease